MYVYQVLKLRAFFLSAYLTSSGFPLFLIEEMDEKEMPNSVHTFLVAI
jgi:hypothetical protein